ncbi:MAG: MFS transporter [Elusimicrobiaceae bacterium]|nr:MFS transporter [Elusimicrobiaceae bacterium]
MNATRRAMILLSVANGLLLFGYGLSLPFFTVYLISQKGMSASWAGLIIALSSLSRSFSSALAGELSDAFGRKNIMLWGLGLEVAAMLGLALCIEHNAHLGWILVTYFLTAFLGAAFRPASNAWVSDNTTPKQRVEAFGIIRIGVNLGWALGPAVGGFLVRYSYSYAFYFTALAYALTVLYVQRTLRDKSAATGQSRRPNFVSLVTSLKDSKLAKICFYVLLITAVNSQLVVGLSVHCHTYLNMPEYYIGWFFTINGLATILLQYPASKMMEKMRLSTALFLGCLLYAVGYGSVGFFDTFLPIAFGVFLASVGELIVNPAEQTITSNIADSRTRGRYLGMIMVFYNLGSSVGFFAAGWLGQYVAPVFLAGPWLIIGAVGLLAGVGFLRLRRDLTDEQDGKYNVPVPVKKDTVTLH